MTIPADSNAFEPDASRVRLLDRRMRSRLADSLDHVAERSAGIVPFDVAALARLTAALRGDEPFAPATFALYYDLVEAIRADRLDDAEILFLRLSAEKPTAGGLRIARFDGQTLGEETVARFARLMESDPVTPFIFSAPPAELFAGFRDQLGTATALMRSAAPDLAYEFNALIRQILVANGHAASGAFEFDGASSFLLWGALFLNPTREHNRVSLVEALAHEAAHNLLFGLSIDDILVLNPETELFTSPLRVDPRPMEGIYHATFVSARMAYAVTRLLASGRLDPDETAFARESLAASRRAFDGGLGTVSEHARLTERGVAIIDAARSYMALAA